MNEMDSFASNVTKEEYKINHCFDCNENCFIYLFTCKVCLKQYVGQTVYELRLRWNNYKTNNRKDERVEPCMQEHLFEYFSVEGHDGFLEDISITVIDKESRTAFFGLGMVLKEIYLVDSTRFLFREKDLYL